MTSDVSCWPSCLSRFGSNFCLYSTYLEHTDVQRQICDYEFLSRCRISTAVSAAIWASHKPASAHHFELMKRILELQELLVSSCRPDPLHMQCHLSYDSNITTSLPQSGDPCCGHLEISVSWFWVSKLSLSLSLVELWNRVNNSSLCRLRYGNVIEVQHPCSLSQVGLFKYWLVANITLQNMWQAYSLQLRHSDSAGTSCL